MSNKEDLQNELFHQAINNFEMKKISDCIVQFTSILSFNPDHIPSLLYLANINYEHIKNIEEAVKYFQLALKLDPKNSIIYYKLGCIS